MVKPILFILVWLKFVLIPAQDYHCSPVFDDKVSSESQKLNLVEICRDASVMVLRHQEDRILRLLEETDFNTTCECKCGDCKNEIKQYRDCLEILKETPAARSGVYTIYPEFNVTGFNVYCDMETENGGWTVFQRRKDGSVDFYRGWNDYKAGFGSPGGEFWLGLDKIHKLLVHGSSKLLINMEDNEKGKAYAVYSDFLVGSEASGYSLNFSTYEGNVRDSLSGGRSKGMKFTTKDRDNDNYKSLNCAIRDTGAWWYNECQQSNLNGMYDASKAGTFAGVRWYTFSEHIEFVEMKTRREE